MFKINSMGFVRAMQLVSAASISEKMFVGAAAVAATVAERLDLPTAPVESATGYYAKMLAMSARGDISEFNDCCPIDTTVALELVRKFWLFRYNTLYGTAPYVGVEGDFFCGYMQCSVNFSPVEIAQLNKHAVAIASLQNHVRLVIEEQVKPSVSGVTISSDTSIVAHQYI